MKQKKKTETFRRKLDKQLKAVLDEHTIHNFAMCVAAENNIIVKQVRYLESATH